MPLVGQNQGLSGLYYAQLTDPRSSALQRSSAVQQLNGFEMGGLGSIPSIDEMDDEAIDAESDDMIDAGLYLGAESALDTADAGLGSYDDPEYLTDKDKWLALAQAGLGALASGSSNGLQAIGQGGLMGLQALTDLRKQRALEALRRDQQEQLSAYRAAQVDNARTRNEIMAQRAGAGTSLEKNMRLLHPDLQPGTPEYVQAAQAIMSRPMFASPEGKGDIATAEALAKLNVDNLGAARAGRDNAWRQKQSITQFREALNTDRFQTGAFSGARKFAGELLVMAGQDPEKYPIIGDPATAEALEAASKNMAAQTIQDIEGLRGTNMGIRLTEDTVANLTRTPEGNRLILDLKERLADQAIQEGDIYESWAADPTREKQVKMQDDLRKSREKFIKESQPLVADMMRKAKDAPKSWDSVLGVQKTQALRPVESITEEQWQRSAAKRGITVEEAKRRYMEALSKGQSGE